MATIRKRGPRSYQVLWRHEGVEHGKTFRLAQDAKDFKATVEVELARGDWLDPREGRMTVAEFAEAWLPTKHDVARSTFNKVESQIRNHLLPSLGERSLSSIKPVDIEAWVADLASSGLVPSTVRAIYNTAGQVFATAERDRLIRRTPFLGIKLPPEGQRREMTFLTPEQVDDLAHAFEPRYEALIHTAAYSGLRQGELFALTIADLDLLRGTIAVSKSLNDLGSELLVGPTKTRQTRTVRIPPTIAEGLAAHLRHFPSNDGLVFSAAEGGFLRRSNFIRRHFHPAVKASRIPTATHFHDLRHTCAAIFISKGWSLEQLKRHLGHSTIRVTSDRYAHLYPGHDDDLLDSLDRDLRGRPPRTSRPTLPAPSATVTSLHAHAG